MNDNQYKQAELSRALTEALFLAQSALESDARQLKGNLEDDPQCKEGSVKELIEAKMHESFEGVQLIRDTIKRRGHKDVVQRLREHELWLRNP